MLFFLKEKRQWIVIEIFEYSNNFLEEIKENLLELRIKKKSNPQNLIMIIN